MQVLHDRFSDQSAVSVLAVHYDDRNDATAYLEKNGYTFPNIPVGTEVTKAFGIDKLPTFLVVGPDGTVVHTHRGLLTDEARDEIDRVAREASARAG